jgi:exodeoxyribonuclease VII large subunit
VSVQTANTNVLTVTELNTVIRNILESEPRLIHCYVAGEISNFKHHVSGHMYFTLKDDKSRIRAVMFAGKNRHIAFSPEDGMRVIVTGSIGVFDRDGQYQMYVEDMQPDGVGALYVAFTQLKGKLEAEGLFAVERKKTLPAFPRRVGVVTSPTGAVIRDICSTLRRRYPLASVLLSPSQVQGATAAVTIVEGIERLIQWSMTQAPIDVIIVARGGGSLEELWPFNEEIVARAVAASPIPVISAVGHETDFTMCDFVADVRAATPTAAAELVAPYVRDLQARLDECQHRVKAAMRWRIGEQQKRLTTLSQAHVLHNPLQIVHRIRQNVDYLESQIHQYATKPLTLASRNVNALRERLFRVDMTRRLSLHRQRLDKLEGTSREWITGKWQSANTGLDKLIVQLEALNPLGVLRRGYSVVYKSDEKTVVQTTKQLRPGEAIRIQFSDGKVKARIEDEEDAQYERGIQSRLDI